MLKEKHRDIYVLMGLVLTGIILCFMFGQDCNWDLANYHYYTTWALFHNKIGYDIMPAGVQSYFNPTMDFLLYFLIKHFNNNPYFIEAIQSIWWGVSVFFIYKISGLIFSLKNERLYLLLAVFIGATSVISILEIGLSFNDLIISTFVLAAMYFYLKEFYINKTQSLKILFFSSFIFGAVTGLKFSGILFFIPFFILHVLFLIKEKQNIFISVFIILFGFIFGFSVTGLWWYMYIYQKFGNPFFPLMNNIFKSEYSLPISWADTRFFPKSILQYLFFPFYWVFDYKSIYVIEAKNIDYRTVFMYLISVVLIIRNIFVKIFWKSHVKDDSEKIISYLLYFIVITYIIWINTSCIIRYMMPVMMLSGILIIGSVYLFFRDNFKVMYVLCMILSTFLFFSTKYIDTNFYYYRTKFKNTFITPINNNFGDNDVVLLFGGFPYNSFIPFENPKVKFIYIYGETGKYHFIYPDNVKKDINKIIDENKDNLFVIYNDDPYCATINWEYIKEFTNIERDNLSCKIVEQTNGKTYNVCKYIR